METRGLSEGGKKESKDQWKTNKKKGREREMQEEEVGIKSIMLYIYV